jgi:Flp pilus assembly protein TadG
VIRLLSRFWKARDGASLVEFSLLAPVLILLMCGLSEFGNALRQYHIMEKGVRDAARYLTRVPMSGCTLNGGAVTAAQYLALTGQTTAGGDYFLDQWTDPSTVTVALAQCVANAQAPYQDLGLLSVIGIGDLQLEVSHQQLWIGN